MSNVSRFRLYGYENVLAILADLEHEEYEDMRVWVDENCGIPFGIRVTTLTLPEAEIN
jgi:hypothetical protein